MGNEEANSSKDPKKIGKTDSGSKEKTEFNAGGNDSDYDGGHPRDVSSDSSGRIHSGEEGMNRKEGADEESGNAFNAGGNDSDYDGGHPKDVSADSPGHIDSNQDNPKNTQK